MGRKGKGEGGERGKGGGKRDSQIIAGTENIGCLKIKMRKSVGCHSKTADDEGRPFGGCFASCK